MLILTSLCLGSGAHSAIQDRINDCERNGGGACIYDILRELGSRRGGAQNRSVEVKFFDDLSCRKQMGQGKIRRRNPEGRCRTIIRGISSFADIDAMSVDGECFDIENDNSYTLDELTEICVQTI